MTNPSSHVGTILQWRTIRILKPEWHLYHEGRLVASIRTKGFLRSMYYVARYDSHDLDITYERRENRTTFRIDNAEEVIGTLTNVDDLAWRRDGVFHYVENGRDEVFVIKDHGQGFIQFLNSKGTILAEAEHKSAKNPTTFAFSWLNDSNNSINPWLVAIVCHYFSMVRNPSG